MEILYISSACSKKTFNNNQFNSKRQKEIYGMPVSSNKFHGLIMKGLSKKNNVYSLVGRPISRMTHDKIFWKNYKEVEDKVEYKYLPIINIPCIKQIIVGFSCYFNIIGWRIKHRNEEKVIVYDASYVTVIPFIILACIFSKIKKIAIFADIYNYMADVDTSNRKTNFMFKIMKKVVRVCYNNTDKYIFLSKQMNELINKKNKPYDIIEGLVDLDMINSENIFENKDPKDVIMYAGTLKEEYGLKILLEGFMKYKNENAELWIFGEGNYADEISKYEKIDSRIKYGGVLDNAQIIHKEVEATLLINPRPTDLEFTKYSFPSKIMEYMVSGTPVLTTKLPTIPKEYNDYVLFIEKETPEGIKNALENSINKYKKCGLDVIGKKSKKFVLDNKNNVVQANKILKI